MTTITDFVDREEAIRVGGYPVVDDTRPPAELTNADLDDIIVHANGTVKGDTGVHSMEDTNEILGWMLNAGTLYAGYLIRLQWEDRGNRMPVIIEEYKRLIGRIAESTQEEIPGIEPTSEGFSWTSSYKSHGLNEEVPPYFSTTE